MLSHHAQVFDQLNSLYNDADVYIATSDKVEPGKSPFNFKEKKQIIASHGIDPARVLYARSPYNWEELAQYVGDVENTVIFFAVGEKDMESNPRFKFDNLDDNGINQKIKGGATYYQMINTYKDEPLPMNLRGYILKVPTISTEEEVASASAFRKAISTAPDKESAKLIFNKQFKEFNNNVFELVYNKLKGEKMSEDLNIMRILAGLEVSEGAPIEFEDQVSVKDVNFAEVSKSSSKLSIANRFPQGSDVNDMEVKKDMYVKELLKSPVALLSEINERIMPDDNGLAVSSKLNKIIDGMRDGGVADLEAEDRGFVMDLVKHSLKNMELEAGDDREFDPETSSLESLELDDIRADYDIEEGKVKDMGMDQADAFYDKVSDIADESNDIQKAIIDAWNDEDENPPVWALDSAAQDILADAGLIEPEPEEPDMEESAPFGEPSQEEEQYNLLITAYENSEEDLAEVLGLSMQELDQEMTEFAMDHNLHMDDDRDEVVQGYIEQVVDNADYKDHGEPAKEESFDPRMEPSREEEAMNHVADGNFGQAAAVLGDTSPNAGDNLMGEWSEYCSIRGLDQKDSLNDFDHVENFVGEIIGSMDDKSYPAEMESIEEQENAIVGKALDDAMIDLKKLAGLY